MLILGLAGCAGTRPAAAGTRPTAPTKPSSAESVLATYFLMSALRGELDDYLLSVYPVRAQLVTFSVIGFHRERGDWPSTLDELVDYIAESPANPHLPADALAGLQLQTDAENNLVYSTLEDRQRGREFTISPAHQVSFPVPAYPFAGKAAPETKPDAEAPRFTFHWSEILMQVLIEYLTRH